ncbi:unnamed protein product [Rotaria sordida]|uniref:Uncharacterized protein n=1 Tax=Rotaria sordida TaxID=392033 RepID=A0A815RQD1_9BILA|nr:unnamed protein product [Rotaria sordida]CAF1479482.1 unnamed protein product [Rotaria sordida]
MRKNEKTSIKANTKTTFVEANTKAIPDVPSEIQQSSRYNNLLKVVALILGLLMIGTLAAIIPAVVLYQIQQTTTSTIVTGVTSAIGSNSTTVSSISSSSSSASSTTIASSISTACPLNVCTYSTWYTLTSSEIG